MMESPLTRHRTMAQGRTLPAAAAALLIAALYPAASSAQNAAAAKAVKCGSEATGIVLPPGFCATIFADNIGHARQLVAAPDGVVYVNTWAAFITRTMRRRRAGFWSR